MTMIIIISVKGESVAPGFHCSSGRGPTCRSGLTFNSADPSEHCTFAVCFDGCLDANVAKHIQRNALLQSTAQFQK